MIAKWKVGNFKSISRETELDFAPLTIFAGANSSGKSTFIQSILLVAQTLSNKVGSRSVVLNGAMTSLGQFDDLKSFGSGSDLITIKCTCQVLPSSPFLGMPLGSLYNQRRFISRTRIGRLREVSCEIAFDGNIADPNNDFYQIQPRLFLTNIDSIFRDRENVDLASSLNIRQGIKGSFSDAQESNESVEFSESLLDSFNYEVFLDEDGKRELGEDYYSAVPVGCVLRHFLPERIVYKIDKVEENANLIYEWLCNGAFSLQLPGHRFSDNDLVINSQVIGILKGILIDVEFQGLFDQGGRQVSIFHPDVEVLTVEQLLENIRSLRKETRVKAQQFLREHKVLLEEIRGAVTDSDFDGQRFEYAQLRPERKIAEGIGYLNLFFSNSLRYLGPLREAPRPIYPLFPAADPNDIGLHGEHTAAVYELHKNRKVKYLPSENFGSPVVSKVSSVRTLEGAVNDWLQYLGVAENVSTKDRGKLGHELKVDLGEAGISHDLTHVGVGVSQVLPILVMCLLANEDSTMVFEQPELHLHPKVQTLLGDFFLSVGLNNKQCVVETHSEYLIDRLRFRMASAPVDAPLSSFAQIYFVEKKKGISEFRSVKINDYGAIVDWPDGFFDQSQNEAEAILLAAARKRELNKKKKSD